ncbi:MAG: SAP domain-containing protein [Desulfuromonadales bacterium]|nr:SAP domain-containing protein [Desulfuromonadales bacterium]
MKLDEIKEIAKRHGITPGRMKKAELVRTIQQFEKNDPCFETGKASTCEQTDCLWKEDCR